jgi:hypothetical protein
LQFTAVPAAQVPPWHVDTPLHRLPSSQLVPFVTGVCVIWPVAVTQASVVQGFESSTLTGAPGRQVPEPLQLSPVVQPLPSLQAAARVLGVYVQVPPLHVPVG